ELTTQRLQELHDLGALDRAIAEPKHEVRVGQPRDGRNVLPVEVKLHHRRLAFERPGAHSSRTLRKTRLVDKDDQPSLGDTLFLSAGQLLRFHVSTAASSRSRARRSGLCEL